MSSEELTIQKLHWDNIKKGYPYIEDNNDGYIYGIEYSIGLGDTDQQWFTSEAERDGVVEEMVAEDNYLEIEEPYQVNPLVTNLVQEQMDKGLLR
jgi:hypothetical protein